MRFAHFVRALAYRRHRADRHGCEGDARRVGDERRFHLSKTSGGTFVGGLVLDPVAGTIVSGALRRTGDELLGADRSEARERQGDHARAADRSRTPAQRRAAVVEMARRAAPPRPRGGGPSRGSASWWATSPSPGRCASWPTPRR